MTFLELCQRVRQEAGISGTGPAAVTGQTGESKRIVDWVQSAWQDIQMMRPNWRWMRASFSFNTVSDDYDYTSAQAGIASRFSSWDEESFKIYLTSLGTSDQVELERWPYEDFRRIFLTGPQTANRPACFTIGHDLSILLGPKPNGIYTVSGEYRKSIQTFSANTDVPEMPADYHMAIVYRALMMYARYDAAGEIYADAYTNLKRFINLLELNQLPPVEMADPLC